MSDPELRRWSEEGASDDENLLLDAARSLEPSAASQRKIVGAVLVASVAAPTTAAAAHAFGGVTKILLGMVAIGGVTTAVVLTRPSAPPKPATVTAPLTPARVVDAEPTEAVPAPAENPPVKVPAAKANPTKRKSVAVKAPVEPVEPVPTVQAPPITTAPPASSLAQEVAALESVRSALATEGASRALALLDRYDLDFPVGALRSEASVLRVQALIRQGDLEAASRLSRTLSQQHPDSPYALKVERLVREAQKSKRE